MNVTIHQFLLQKWDELPAAYLYNALYGSYSWERPTTTCIHSFWSDGYHPVL
jgi:hypothetical protein